MPKQKTPCIRLFFASSSPLAVLVVENCVGVFAFCFYEGFSFVGESPRVCLHTARSSNLAQSTLKQNGTGKVG